MKSNNSFDSTFDEFNITEIEKFNSTDDNNVCRIEIQLDYASRVIKIKFGDDGNISDSTSKNEVHLITHMILTDDNEVNGSATITNILKYQCSNEDECDRSFALNHTN